MLIRLGHSPDPHDAIMFRPLADGRVDTRGFEFELVVEQLETLNDWALAGTLDVGTIAVAAYPRVQDEYVLLPYGMRMSSSSDHETSALVHRLAATADLAEASLDPGEWWLLETGLPVPIAVTVARRSLGADRLRNLAAGLADAIEAAETVDDYRCDHGEEGRLAVRELLERADALGIYERPVKVEFVQL